jgi:hypothetical protein
MTTAAPTTEVPDPTALVRAAVEALDRLFFEPLVVAGLFADAWAGAAAALARAGVSPVPPPPAYPADPGAASAVHAEAFPALERLGAGRLSPDELAAAALRELIARRRDGHTALFTPQMLDSQRSTRAPPRPRAGTWVIDLSEELVEALREHRARQAEDRLRAGPRWVDHDLIFYSRWGTPLLPDNFRRDFRALLERAGLPTHYRPHDLRHTAASHLLAESSGHCRVLRPGGAAGTRRRRPNAVGTRHPGGRTAQAAQATRLVSDAPSAVTACATARMRSCTVARTGS